MRRLRRRGRWIAAAEGAATGLVVGAGIVTLVPLAVRRLSAATLAASGVPPLLAAAALLVAAAIGAAIRGGRSVPLDVWARAVDRAALRGDGDDCVLAAVALAEAGGAQTPFLNALIKVAV